MSKKVEIIESMIADIRKLATFAKEKNTDKKMADYFEEVYSKAMVCCSINPYLAADATGESLYKYYNKIIKEDFSFFLDNTYDDDVKNIKSEQKKEATKKLMDPVKNIWKNCDKKEQAKIVLIVKQLLLNYIKLKGDETNNSR